MAYLPGHEKQNGTTRVFQDSIDFPRTFPAPSVSGKGIKSDIIGSSNPELFVVLVTTGCCDLQYLKRATSDPSKRTPEVAQLFHLLDGLNGYARQLGVRLIVYDLPYQPN